MRLLPSDTAVKYHGLHGKTTSHAWQMSGCLSVVFSSKKAKPLICNLVEAPASFTFKARH